MPSMIYVDATGIDSNLALERWVRSAEKIARALPRKVMKPTRSVKRRSKAFRALSISGTKEARLLRRHALVRGRRTNA